MPKITYFDAKHEDLAYRTYRANTHGSRDEPRPQAAYGFDPDAPRMVMSLPTLKVRLFKGPAGEGEETGQLLALGSDALTYCPDPESPSARLMGEGRSIWAHYRDVALDGPRSQVRPDAAWLTHYLRSNKLARHVRQEREDLVREAPNRWLEVADVVAPSQDPLLQLRAFHQPEHGPLYSCPLDLPIRQSQLTITQGPALDPAYWLLLQVDHVRDLLRKRKVEEREQAQARARERLAAQRLHGITGETGRADAGMTEPATRRRSSLR